MDRKFNADNQWFSSPLIDLSKFKADAIAIQNSMQNLVPVEKFEDLSNIIEARAGCSKETVENVLADVLAIEQFSTNPIYQDKSLDEWRTIHQELGDLNDVLYTHKNLQQRNQYMEASRQRKAAYVANLKYDKYNFEVSRRKIELDHLEPLESGGDILLTCDILMPYNRALTANELRTSRLLKAQAKVLLRGETCLYDLRQHLVCLSDVVVPLEDGKELEAPDYPSSTAEKYPSSFIFINDTFYLDMSHDNAIDISEPIRNFMAKKAIFNPTKTEDMRKTKIIDLKLRLGQPYIFQHSGNCEHLLIFHDLRMLHTTDAQNLNEYPIVVYEKATEKRCDACHKENSAFVVEKSELMPNTFQYFCEECFREFNFTNGLKNHKFRAWPVFGLNRLRE